MGILKYLLTEIGYDTSEESTESLIRIARQHCEETNLRGNKDEYLPIENLEQAIHYFNNNGFEVRYKYAPSVKIK